MRVIAAEGAQHGFRAEKRLECFDGFLVFVKHAAALRRGAFPAPRLELWGVAGCRREQSLRELALGEVPGERVPHGAHLLRHSLFSRARLGGGVRRRRRVGVGAGAPQAPRAHRALHLLLRGREDGVAIGVGGSTERFLVIFRSHSSARAAAISERDGVDGLPGLRDLARHHLKQRQRRARASAARRARRHAKPLVVFFLLLPSSRHLRDRLVHRRRVRLVREENRLAAFVARGAAHHLHQRAGRAREPGHARVQHDHQADLRDVQPFAK